MVILVGDNNMPFPRHGNSSRPVKLAWAHSFCSELVLELSIGIEHLYPVVAPVTYDYVPLLIATNPPRATKLAIS